MDGRWQPISPDSAREVKIVLHPTAAIWEVRRGLDPGSDDSIDLSEFVKDARQTAFDFNVTLVFNRELFGQYQPKPNQVIEIQLRQNDEWKPLWLGHIDAINSFTMSRGERQMQLIAKTRDQQDIWRNAPRVSPLFPQMTNFTYMIQRIARSAEMKGDEIVLPPSSLMTAHSNTQLADMTAWDMVSSIMVALGWTPFIDAIGRLRAADKGLQNRSSDIKLTDDRMVKVGGQRQRPPVSRIKVSWLDPELKMWKQTGRKLAGPIVVTLGWFMPYWKVHVDFSSDGTQRATGTYKKILNSVNTINVPGLKFCTENWIQQSPTGGKLSFVNFNTYAMLFLLTQMTLRTATRVDFVAGAIPVATPAKDELYAYVTGLGESVGPVIGNIVQVGTPVAGALYTVPSVKGSIWESIAHAAFALEMMNIGTGSYEIWGDPYNYVHSKNVSEAFDTSVPTWVNRVQEINCDFITNEGHAKAVATRELIYTARSANKWSVTIVDDPRIEYGDLLEFPDGSQLFVEDFTRSLGRGSEATIDISGFLVGRVGGGGKMITIVGGTPDIGIGAPGQPGGGPEGGTPGAPGAWDGVMGSDAAHPIVAMSIDPDQLRRDVTASFNHYDPIARAAGISIGTIDQWVGYASQPELFSSMKWYNGWNKYWEDRMDIHNPGFSGSADPGGGDHPAVYRA
jgi:hypothetical protein